jgi:hypothetical protein
VTCDLTYRRTVQHCTRMWGHIWPQLNRVFIRLFLKQRSLPVCTSLFIWLLFPRPSWVLWSHVCVYPERAVFVKSKSEGTLHGTWMVNTKRRETGTQQGGVTYHYTVTGSKFTVSAVTDNTCSQSHCTVDWQPEVLMVM